LIPETAFAGYGLWDLLFQMARKPSEVPTSSRIKEQLEVMALILDEEVDRGTLEWFHTIGMISFFLLLLSTVIRMKRKRGRGRGS